MAVFGFQVLAKQRRGSQSVYNLLSLFIYPYSNAIPFPSPPQGFETQV